MDAKDHDDMIRLITTVESLRDDITELKKAMKDKPCPSPMCGNHETRLVTLETYFRVIAPCAVIGLTAVIGLILDKVL